eukprot:TRINITY_DN18073_c0_g1_i1.p1 TRINITY_DN18073_c0_g1~~TRINITY_DN18073_c0_g1_i1.p1  ORF type:complete len:681 (+),score=157.65 TRINITY_DN18073_c0_g1_i1:189-2045(+)
MNADSSNADFRLTFVPPREHSLPADLPVFTYNLSYPRWVGYGRGEFFHPHPANHPLSEAVGKIPQVAKTFGYYEATEPLMNDQGLALGESSCAASLVNRFPGDEKDTRDVPTGLLDTVTLMQLALERCVTARCGAEVMGKLSEEFGFVPTPGEPSLGRVAGRQAWDDAGEAYTLADRNGDAWVFHVVGGWSGITKSVWAAQKVPKGHIAIVANEFIIGELPEEPNDEYLFNSKIRDVARAAGLWSGRGPLHFTKVFTPDAMTFESPAGADPLPLYASVRRFGINKLAAPSGNHTFHMDNSLYPFSIAVENKITHRDVMKYFRTQYEGTEFDLTQGILAGPWGNPFRPEGGPGSGQIPRGVSIQRTLYGIIGQSGPKSKPVAWFAMDTPSTSVYVPLYSETGTVSEIYANGHHSEFTTDSAWWAFNAVSNFMQLNFAAMSKSDVFPAIEAWQDKIDEQRERLERSGSLTDLGKWQTQIQEEIIANWWKLRDSLTQKYNDGCINSPAVGRSWGYPQWYASMVGFSDDVHPVWVQAAERPAEEVLAQMPSFVEPSGKLPKRWSSAEQMWVASLEESAAGFGTQRLVILVVLVCSFVCSFFLGRSYERRQHNTNGNYKPLLG